MNEMQKSVQAFCSEHNLNAPPNARFLDLVSEIGEVAKEFLQATSYGQRDELKKNHAIIIEFGDLVFSLMALGNSLGVDAREALDLALDKYEERIKNKNTPSS